MNKDEQIKALAELDGWTFDPLVGYWRDSGGYAHGSSKPLPYLTSHDAIIPLLRNQPEYVKARIVASFWTESLDKYDDFIRLLLATPPQLAEALLRASGKWQETK